MTKIQVLAEISVDELCEGIDSLSETLPASAFGTFSYELMADLLHRCEHALSEEQFMKLLKRTRKLLDQYEKTM